MATTTPAGVRAAHAKHGGGSQGSHGSPDGAPMSHRQIMEALTGLLLGMFVAILSSTIVSNALPDIIKDLGGGQSAYTWVVTASLLAMTASTPLWGKLADLISKKLLIQIALVIFVAGSAAAGLSQNAAMLIGFRAVQGIGMGGLSALAQIILAAMISPRERGRYNGYLGATFATAMVGGPLIGGVITDTSWLGWRWCFYVGVPFAVIALVVLQRTLHLPVVKRQVKVDWAGAFFITVAVCLLLVWVTFAGDKYDWLSWQTAAMLGGTLALLGIFVLVESKASEPIIPLRLFRNRTITLASLASLFVGIAMFAGTIFFSQYFQLARDKSPTMSGVMTIPMIGGLFVASTVSGQVITRTGRWKAWLLAGGVLVTAGLGLLGTLRYDTAYWHVAIYMALLGLGVGMMMQNLVLCTQNQVDPSDLGVASSVVTFFRSLGGAIGVSALGAVLSHRITTHLQDGLATLDPKYASALSGSSSNTIPDLDALPAPLRTVIEGAYGHGIGDVFLYAAPAALLALVFSLFIKEVPLRTKGALAQAAEEKEALSAPAAGTPAAETETVAEKVPVEVGGTGVTRVEVELASGASLQGVVRAPHGPLSDVRVTLVDAAGNMVGTATTGADGAYAFTDLDNGEYTVIATGYPPVATALAVTGRGADGHDIELAHPGGE